MDADRVLASKSEKAEGLMDLMLRKVMLRLSFGGGTGVIKSMVMARWSEMWRLRMVSWWRVRLAEQTRSKMWPRQWVGKMTCLVK